MIYWKYLQIFFLLKLYFTPHPNMNSFRESQQSGGLPSTEPDKGVQNDSPYRTVNPNVASYIT